MNDSQVASESLPFIPGNAISNEVRILHGQYLEGISSSKGRLKYLQLQQNGDVLRIKLPKLIGDTLVGQLKPGMMLKMWVRPTENGLKALMVVPAGAEIETKVGTDVAIAPVLDDRVKSLDQSMNSSSKLNQTGCTLNVCTKGKCYKKGGRQLLQALEAAVSENGLGQYLNIKSTGCLKNCKQGPTVQVSPGSETYSFVRPQDALTIAKHHANSHTFL